MLIKKIKNKKKKFNFTEAKLLHNYFLCTVVFRADTDSNRKIVNFA